MPAAEIIAIGTELLLGETADTNTRFLARGLRGLGIDLFRTQTIGDNATRIAESVRQALERAEIVITTGGLGPTVDDPTRQAIADSVDTKLEFHPELWEQIAARIARYGRTPTGNQKRQAYIPSGAIVIQNPVGTAPAFIMEVPVLDPPEGPGGMRKVIISLPGVPGEMETLFTDAIVPYLQTRFDLHAVLKIRTLHVSGLGEGSIDDQIGDLEMLANPTVGLAAHAGCVDIRITAKGESETEAVQKIVPIELDLRNRLGNNIFGSDGETLEMITLDTLAKRGWTLACLENDLEGILLARLTRTSHPAYLGGTSSQVRSEPLAAGLDSIRKKFRASTVLGVACSQDGEKHVIDMLLVTPHGKVDHHLTYGGHPANARRWAANMALDWLRRIAQEAG
jgi:nicotinamide-nucleotide amidase